MKHLATVALALAVAAVFTWPAPVAGDDVLVGRGFDATGMLWMGWYASEHLATHGLTSPVSGLPDSEALHGTDAWLHLLLSMLWSGFATARAHHLLAWLGCAATFVAGERMAARAFGARWPWSLVAGLALACNGIAFAALLAGRHYHLFQAGLPLFVWAWVRVLRGERAGVWAGLAWVLCLASSVYTALLASAAGAWLWLWRSDRLASIRQQLLGVAVALPPFAAFVYAFTGSERPVLASGTPTLEQISRSTHLASLLGWNPAHAESALYSGAAVGFAAFGVALAGRRWLPRARWSPLFWGGVLAVVLSLGSFASVLPHALEPLPTPIHLLNELWEPLAEFKFYARLMLLAYLAFGTLAAMALSSSTGWLRYALAGCIAVDALFWGRPVGAAVTVVAPGNELYTRIDQGGVLDLVPNASSGTDRGLLNAIHHACASQPLHGQPVVDVCLSPTTRATPGVRLRRRVLSLLMDGQHKPAARALREAGVEWVVLHPDLFSRFEAKRLEASLRELSRAPASAVGGGEHLVLFQLRRSRAKP